MVDISQIYSSSSRSDVLAIYSYTLSDLSQTFREVDVKIDIFHKFQKFNL